MKLAVLAGDGIGPEVTDEAVRVLEAVEDAKLLDDGTGFEFTHGAIGHGAYLEHGTPLPDATLELVRESDAALLGAVTTPPDIEGYRSPVLKLRQELDLYACVRPIRSLPDAERAIDMVFVRENTEGLYSGVERADAVRAVTERVITRKASERIVLFALELARQRGDTTLMVVHKANVLRATCGLFRKVAFEVGEQMPGIRVEEMLVDTCAMELIRAPEQFGVIVTTNLFGDILSDEASMLVGGLGLASSANIGSEAAVFEPVHGSAPDIAGTGRANPFAAIGAAALMLEHVGEMAAAASVEAAIEAAVSARQVTPDLGGALTTTQATDVVIAKLVDAPNAGRSEAVRGCSGRAPRGRGRPPAARSCSAGRKSG